MPAHEDDWIRQESAEAEAWAEIKWAIAHICEYAWAVRSWGGDRDGDGIERSLSDALDYALPSRTEPRKPSGKPTRKPMSLRLRTMVMERDAYRCVKCGAHERLQVDHIHPVILGGTNDLDNLQTLCISCNSAKGGRAP